MTDFDPTEVLRLMREARKRDRGYASFFGWGIDRDLEELGPVRELANALATTGGETLTQLRLRGRGNDPPDLEAVDEIGRRVAIEVTELVDENAIRAFKSGDLYAYAEWTKEAFLSKLQGLVLAKASRRSKLLGGPYPGGYVIVVFTDEPMLSPDTVSAYLSGATFRGLEEDCRAYLLLSYWPATESYPHYVLRKEA